MKAPAVRSLSPSTSLSPAAAQRAFLPKPASPAWESSLLFSATQSHTTPTYPPLLTDPGPRRASWRPRLPETRPLRPQGAPASRNRPAAVAGGLPLRRRGRPATRPPAGPGRRPSFPSFRGPRRDRTGSATPREAGQAGGPSRPAMTPHGPRRPRRQGPHPAPRSPAASAPPHSRSPGPGQSCVGETAQRERAGVGGRRERKGSAARPVPLRPPPPAKEGKGESREHNSPRLAPAAARARRRLSLGGGHYTSCSRTPHSSPSRPSAACSAQPPPTGLPAAASLRPHPLARLRLFRLRGPMAARLYYISERGRGLAGTVAPQRLEQQGTSRSVPGAPPPRSLACSIWAASAGPRSRVISVLAGDGPQCDSQVACSLTGAAARLRPLRPLSRASSLGGVLLCPGLGRIPERVASAAEVWVTDPGARHPGTPPLPPPVRPAVREALNWDARPLFSHHLPFTSFPWKPQLFDHSGGFSEFKIHA